jgi:hypothetical protein
MKKEDWNSLLAPVDATSAKAVPAQELKRGDMLE